MLITTFDGDCNHLCDYFALFLDCNMMNRIIPRGTRTIRIHVEIMWDSVNHLLDAFNVADGKALECNI